MIKLITRKLEKEKDFEQFAEVSSSAYIHDAAETTFNEDEDIFGTFVDDGKTLISQIESITRNLWYGETLIPCTLVGGVASKPEYRRMGGVRETFKIVFEHALDKGSLVSILYPFSISYYRKFGYEIIGNYYDAQCSFLCFKNIDRFTDVTLLKEQNKEEFFKVYTEICKKYNMMFERKNFEEFSLTPYNDCNFTYFVNDGDSKGYLSVKPIRANRTIEVTETGHTDKNALLKLLGFLRTYEGNYDFVNFKKLPQNSVIPDVLDFENRVFKRTMFKDGAGRILDVKAFLEKCIYPQEDGCFSLKITDEQIERNNGIFTVCYKNKKATVTKSQDGDYDIVFDIATASRIILGREGLTLDQISYLSGTQIKNPSHDFIKAFPKATTQFFDEF